MDSVEKFDPSTLMQGVKDRIKATFVSLIPDEQWEVMVKKEIEGYFAYRKDSGYNYQREVSDFGYTVNQVLRAEAEKKIKDLLNSAEFQVQWGGPGASAPEFFRDAIMKKAPEIFEQAVGNVITQAILNMRR